MAHRKLAYLTAVGGAAVIFSLPLFSGAAKEKPADAAKVDNKETCYGCHTEIKGLHQGSRHAGLGCSTCHTRIQEHLSDSKVKPVTTIDQALCGSCHKDEYASAKQVNYESPAHREKGIPGGRSPVMDKLLAPYGFTIEHNEPRSHPFMVIDQFVVDRFAAGRFQFKERWLGVDKTGKTWDVLEDKGPDFKMSETGKAGNPTCIQCKTSDHILKWKFLGDKDPRATWDRSSDVIAVAKDTHNPVGCIHCHDPHSSGPRIVRDELIHRIEGGAKMFADKSGKTDLQVISFRNGFRKIGIMQKVDDRMMCAQCHVEYACGKGFEFGSGKPIGFDDQRTNHMPLVQVKELLDHYRRLNFYDFKHAVTGAQLVKLQHPEMETFSGSVHERAGVTCADCHMPVMKNAQGKSYRSHMMLRPRNHVRTACSGCHPQWTAEQQMYQMDAIQNYIRGKIRKSEYWLSQLIDTYAAAKNLGVPEATLAKARVKHEEAHVLWEWWTAENSDGFHNPDLARESLGASITASKEGVALLNKALEERGKK